MIKLIAVTGGKTKLAVGMGQIIKAALPIVGKTKPAGIIVQEIKRCLFLMFKYFYVPTKKRTVKRLNLFEYGTLKNADSKYLYRGLCEKEVDVGIRLIPKGVQSFEDLKLYKTAASGNIKLDNLGPILSISNHNQGLSTSGVSTSTIIEVAVAYALSSPVGKQYVVRINREKTKLLGVNEHIVKDKLPLWRIQKPDDEEVILTFESGIFPREIIEGIYKADELSIKNLTYFLSTNPLLNSQAPYAPNP